MRSGLQLRPKSLRIKPFFTKSLIFSLFLLDIPGHIAYIFTILAIPSPL